MNITQFYEETLVSFGDLTDSVIQAYIATGEPMWVSDWLILNTTASS